MAMDKDRLADLLRDAGLGDYVEAILQYAKPTIRLHAQPAANLDSLPLGSSRIGGLPDLPPDANWLWRNGRPCEFIAQINLKEASQFDHEGLLPKAGMLYFFFDGLFYEDPVDENFQLYQRASETIIYYAGDISSLKRVTDYPEQIEEWHRYPPCSINFETDWMLPDSMSAHAAVIERKILRYDGNGDELPPLVKAYQELTYKLEPRGDRDKHHLLGHPQPVVQNDALYELTDAFNWNTRKTDESKLEEWTLLLQISSDYEPDSLMVPMFDSGCIYYYIPKNDLIAGQFNNAVCKGESY